MDQKTKDFFQETIRSEIEGLAGMVARGFEHVEARFQKVEGDISELRSEVGGLRSEVGELRSEVGELREDLNAVKLTVDRIDRRTQNQIDALYEDVGILKTAVKEHQAEIVHLKAHVGLTG